MTKFYLSPISISEKGNFEIFFLSFANILTLTLGFKKMQIKKNLLFTYSVGRNKSIIYFLHILRLYLIENQTKESQKIKKDNFFFSERN